MKKPVLRLNLHCQTDTFVPLMSDSINIPRLNILGVPQEAGEAMAERTLPTNIHYPPYGCCLHQPQAAWGGVEG